MPHHSNSNCTPVVHFSKPPVNARNSPRLRELDPRQAERQKNPDRRAKLGVHGHHGQHSLEHPPFSSLPEAVSARPSRRKLVPQLSAGGQDNEIRWVHPRISSKAPRNPQPPVVAVVGSGGGNVFEHVDLERDAKRDESVRNQ